VEERISLVKIKDPFTRRDRETSLIAYHKESLLELRQLHFPIGINVRVVVNGRVIKEEDWPLVSLRNGDQAVFIPSVEDGDALRTIAFIALTVAVAWAAPYAAAYMSGLVPGLGGLSGLAQAAVYYGTYAAVGMGGMMLGGMLIDALLPLNANNLSFGDSPLSQTASWSPVTTQQQGLPIPYFYGKSKVFGNIIDAFTENIEDKNYINLLICLEMGPVKSLSSFEINDQDISTYTKIEIRVRGGYITQSLIPNFDDTKAEYTVNRKVMFGSPVVYRTRGDVFDGLEVDITFPKGVYHMDSSGNFKDHEIDIQVEAVHMSDPTKRYILSGWTGDVTTVHLRWSLGYWTDAPGVQGGIYYQNLWHEEEAGSVVYADHYEGQQVTKAITSKTIDPETGLETTITSYQALHWHWITSSDVGTTSYAYSRIISNKNSAFTKTFILKDPVSFTKGHYDIIVTRINENYSDIKYADDSWFLSVREVFNDDFIYPRKVLVGIKALATDQLSGSLKFSCLLEGRYVRVYRKDEVLGTDGKNYRCKAAHIASADKRPITGASWAAYWSQLGSSSVDNVAPPLKDNVSFIWISGVNYSATASWRIEYSSNPAWVCSDVLTQPVFYDNWMSSTYRPTYSVNKKVRPNVLNGRLYKCIVAGVPGTIEPIWPTTIGQTVVDGTVRWECIAGAATDGVVRFEGFDSARLITTDFQAWADFCDVLVNDGSGGLERRLTFNGGFDAATTIWEAALQISGTCRAVLVWYGYNLSVVIEQAASPVQLFSSGNVIENSFEEIFLPLEDRAGEIEVSYRNIDKDYEKDAVSIFNNSIDRPTNKVSTYLVGAVRESEAWRFAQYCLLGNQYRKRTIQFAADIDAIACMIGDVIDFQHDTPRWGDAGGRIVSATVNSVTLDQTVTIDADITYGILIRLANDTLVTKTVTNVAGSYTVLTVSTPFSEIPVQYDVYAFGQLGVETKPFRVVDISKTDDQIATIRAIEYNANVYSVDTGTPIVQTPDYTPQGSVSVVTNITVAESSRLDESGNVVRDILITFKRPNDALYKQALVFFKKTGQSVYSYAGLTISESYVFINAEPKITYTFLIISESWSGVRSRDSVSPTISITTTGSGDWSGDETLEDIVSGLHIDGQGNAVEFTGRDCKLVWNEISAVGLDVHPAGEEPTGAGYHYPPQWFKDYQVKIFDAVNTLRRTEYVTVNTYVYTYEKNYEDGIDRHFTIEVRARDRYYRTSRIPARLTVLNPAPDMPSNVVYTARIKAVLIVYDANDEPDFQGYVIYGSTTADFTPSSANLLYQGKDTHPLIQLDSGNWYFKVAAYDTFGLDELNYSTETLVRISSTDPTDNVPPDVPTGLALSSGVEQIAQAITAYIEATWNANTEDDFNNYALQLRRDGETRYTEVFSTALKHKFIGLLPGIKYYVKIKGVDKWGNESAFSAEVDTTCIADSSAPATPTGFAVAAGLKKIICSWTANTEEDLAGYEVSIKPDGGVYSVFYKGLSTVVVYDGSPAIKYYAKVRAYDWSGNYSNYASELNATTAQVGTADIQAGAVTSDKVTTGELITLSAQIKDAIITNAKIDSLAVSKLTAGTIGAQEIYLGANSLLLSGTNKNIVVNDGIRDRIKIGLLSTGVYGIQITNTSGVALVNTTTGNIITVDELAVSKLLAGTITSKDIVLAVAAGTGDSVIRAGKTDFTNTESGFILGIDDSDSDRAKFYIGDSSKYLNWNGTELTIGGDIIVTGNLVANAVTTTSSSYNGNDISCPADNTAETVLSCEITVTGGKVLVTGGIQARATTAGAVLIGILLLYRGVTQITAISFVHGGHAGIYTNCSVPLSYLDNPDAGTYTYSLAVYAWSGEDAVIASSRSLVLLEIKR